MRSSLLPGCAVLIVTMSAVAQQWGDVKGQVVWDPKKQVPAPVVLNVAKEPGCLPFAPVRSNEIVINARNRGVQNVLVWLKPIGNNVMPIRANRRAIPANDIVINQPQCQFEPRVVALREGQGLVINNNAKFAHTASIVGNPNLNGANNVNLAAGANLALRGNRVLKAEPRPLMLGCGIHPWMSGRIGVFDHPYFAVTDADGKFEIKDAPAGNFLVYISHEKFGWLHTPRERNAQNIGGSAGQLIAIPANGVLDLGIINAP